MTPLMISETECVSAHDGHMPAHGVTVSLCIVNALRVAFLGQGQVEHHGEETMYQIEVALWAVKAVDQTMIREQLHLAVSKDLDALTKDYTTLAHYYAATRQLTDDEIEDRTHGRYS